MAQVKFNRGQRSVIEASQTLTTNEISLARESASGNDWNSIYLGTYLVGTSMLGLMKPQKLNAPTYTYGDQTTISWSEATIGTTFASGVITTDLVGTENPTPMTTVRKLVNYADATAVGYTANDGEILTAKAVTALVSSVADNTHYDNFTRGTGQSLWTWTAAEQGTDQYGNLTITIPTESTITKDYNTASSGDPVYDYHPDKVPTSKAVTDFVETYFAGLAGGMRYEGSISSTTVPADSKAGDVFIAGQAFTIGTAPNTISVEAGDMIVLNSTYSATAGQTGTLTTTNCDVFERNLNGAVTISSSMTSGQFVVATGAGTVESVSLIYDRVSQNSNALNTITVTTWTNQTQGTGDDVHTYTIDDIYHAKFVNTAQDNTTNSFKDVMIDGTYSDDSGHTTYQAPKHTSNVQINPAVGEIQLHYTASGAQTATTINVAESITSITNTLEWNELGGGA